ncbi:MAG: hypothetical protein JW969_20675 [Spirochaetales bacterium]|nr:hypothetical protein [Spirochaetales bacterium]
MLKDIIKSVFYFTLFLLAALAMHGCAENTRGIPGDSRKFDPVANFNAVAEFAGENALLYGFTIQYIKPDGTVDFGDKYDPYVVYTFFVPNKNKKRTVIDEEIPLGVSQNQPAPEPDWLQVTITVSKPHWESYDDGDVYYPGMRRSESILYNSEEWLEKAPKLDNVNRLPISLSKIWSNAIDHGAPAKNVVANINYNYQGYFFTIGGTGYKFHFDLNGELIN